MYNIVGNNPNFFVQQSFIYSIHRHANFRPITRTQYMYSSFAPSVITTWNTLPNHSLSISAFKRSLQCLFLEAHHISNVIIHVALGVYDMNIIEKKRPKQILLLSKQELKNFLFNSYI